MEPPSFVSCTHTQTTHSLFSNLPSVYQVNAPATSTAHFSRLPPRCGAAPHHPFSSHLPDFASLHSCSHCLRGNAPPHVRRGLGQVDCRGRDNGDISAESLARITRHRSPLLPPTHVRKPRSHCGHPRRVSMQARAARSKRAWRCEKSRAERDAVYFTNETFIATS